MKRINVLITGVIILCTSMLTSCSKTFLSGTLESVSLNKIESTKEYEFKSKPIQLTKKQIRKESCGTLEEAIQKTATKYQNNGTEFLKNVKVYTIYRDYPFWYTIQYTVVGEIWAEKK